MYDRLSDSFIQAKLKFDAVTRNRETTDHDKIILFNKLQPAIQSIVGILKDRAHPSMMSLPNFNEDMELKLL
jgi:hypothetical protein